MQASKKNEGPIADMNVIPFIDICLVLLIIVLVTASFSTQLLGFNHPQAGKDEKTQYFEVKDAVVVEVATDGKCKINGKTVEVKDLKSEAAQFASQPFVLQAGRQVKSEHVILATDQIKGVGNVKLTFAVQEQ